MFESMEMAPPDPILGLTEAFLKDPRPEKINLSVGVFQDAGGRTPVLSCVKKAERRLLETETTKSYKPISGAPEFAEVVQGLLFGPDAREVAAGKVVTAHAPGGTGALRVAGDFLRSRRPETTVWVSDPTWVNHRGVFQAAGLQVKAYPYFDAARSDVDFDGMLACIGSLPAEDVVLLHGCCHNPSGVDLDPGQWARLADVVYGRNLIPLVDFAYQGFADGIEEDAGGIRELCRPGREMMICSSFSKNFGLYNERVGALTIVAKREEDARAVLSHVKVCIRANYSNPPAHGGSIVTEVLRDPGLRAEWEGEVMAMRERIHHMRSLFVDTLRAKGVEKDYSFIKQQKGMFSFSGLDPEQVRELRESHAIYAVSSGRINVAGMTERNMDALCEAIARVS